VSGRFRYFDLGVYRNASEIAIMTLNIFPRFPDWEYECHGFDACRGHYERAKWLFPDANFYHMAIADREGECRLFYATGAQGHSIYESKNNLQLPEKFETVKCTRFTKWLKDNFTDLDSTFNILKYNIEGAELDLFRDLDREDMFKYFKVIKGSSGDDILKCDSIKDKLPEYEDICLRNNIQLNHRFSWRRPLKMKQWINEHI
jgi:hypothetical protein